MILLKRTEEKLPLCVHDEVHKEHVDRASLSMPSVETLYELADFFKIFGDSTRVSILFAIEREEMCVCDVAALLGMTKSAVSHQLKILRGANLVRYRKSGKNVYYTLSDDHVRDIIDKALEHIGE